MSEKKTETGEWVSFPSWGALRRQAKRGQLPAETEVRGQTDDIKLNFIPMAAALHPTLTDCYNSEIVALIKAKSEGTLGRNETGFVLVDDTDEHAQAANALSNIANASSPSKPKATPSKHSVNIEGTANTVSAKLTLKKRDSQSSTSAQVTTPKTKTTKPAKTSKGNLNPLQDVKDKSGPQTKAKKAAPVANKKKDKHGLGLFVILFVVALLAIAAFMDSMDNTTYIPPDRRLATSEAAGADMQSKEDAQTAPTKPSSNMKPRQAEQAPPKEPVKIPAKVRSQVAAVYPTDQVEKPAHSGSVTIRFDITATGYVENMKVENSTDKVFENAALTALAQWRYNPATINGRSARNTNVREIFEFKPTVSEMNTVILRLNQQNSLEQRQRAAKERLRSLPSRNASPSNTQNGNQAAPAPRNTVQLRPTTQASRTTTQPTAIQPRAPTPKFVADEIVPIKRLVAPPPNMPRRAKKSGHCIMIFDVEATGRTSRIRTRSCSQTLFRANAIKSVEKWRYQPRTVNGLPKKTTDVTSKISFRLVDERGRAIPE